MLFKLASGEDVEEPAEEETGMYRVHLAMSGIRTHEH
jgi:hypothetical protein